MKATLRSLLLWTAHQKHNHFPTKHFVQDLAHADSNLTLLQCLNLKKSRIHKAKTALTSLFEHQVTETGMKEETKMEVSP